MSQPHTFSLTLRQEFVRLANAPNANIRLLCRRFGISAKTAYKWLARFRQHGEDGLQHRSRKPHSSPQQMPLLLQQQILHLRQQHPCWGACKIRALLQRQQLPYVPAASTIHALLKRNACVAERPISPGRAYGRFEREAPNQLWQMDFKGHFALQKGRCHPLTILDDHSRYCLGLFACAGETLAVVRDHLITVFQRYGLPQQILCDNGPPWGDPQTEWTALRVWLLRLGVEMIHGHPHHPQTQGKDERFHRTLKIEVLQGPPFADLRCCQKALDQWRLVYNHERPHQALAMAVPAERYQISERCYPEVLPEWQYHEEDQLRRVYQGGKISYQGRLWKVGLAFVGEKVAVRAGSRAGEWAVYWGRYRIKTLDENKYSNHD